MELDTYCRHRGGSGRGKPCGRKASCAWFSCLSRNRSAPQRQRLPVFTPVSPGVRLHRAAFLIADFFVFLLKESSREDQCLVSYLGHNSLTLEAPPHRVIDSLRLSPVWREAFEAILSVLFSTCILVAFRWAILRSGGVGSAKCLQFGVPSVFVRSIVVSNEERTLLDDWHVFLCGGHCAVCGVVTGLSLCSRR